jgi:hypothetical protein
VVTDGKTAGIKVRLGLAIPLKKRSPLLGFASQINSATATAAVVRKPGEKNNGPIPAARNRVTISSSSCILRTWLLALCVAGATQAQAQSTPASLTAVPDAPVPAISDVRETWEQADTGQQNPPLTESQQEKAAQQVKQQEKQRIAGVVPNFNVSYDQDAAPLSRKQKLHIAFRTAIDPASFGIAAFDAGLSQAQNDFPGYGQGAKGYAKRFGASYADNFDGTLIGNAIFPILLKQDPRYFRRGTGSFRSRLLYSLSTTVWSKSDNGKWGPNYSNVLGNLAAGGISNLYYPSSDRGAALTFERGFTVTAYGAFGGVFNEFWPDIAKKIFKDKMAKLQPKVPPAAPPIPAPPPAAPR